MQQNTEYTTNLLVQNDEVYLYLLDNSNKEKIALARINFKESNSFGFALVEEFEIRPDQQGKGLGSFLINQVNSLLKQKKFPGVYFDEEIIYIKKGKSPRKLAGFFLKHGWAEISTLLSEKFNYENIVVYLPEKILLTEELAEHIVKTYKQAIQQE